MLCIPKVSILILTYNRVELSRSCIPGIVDFIGDINAEVLIWDNGSTDGTYDWLEEYGRADCRVTKVFSANENLGMAAINPLAKEANGQYLLKIDDDIVPPPNFAELLVRAYEEVNNPKLGFLGWDMEWGKVTFATRSGMSLYKPPKGETVVLESLPGRVLIHYRPSKFMVNGPCRLCKKDVFLEIGGHPKGMIYGVDHHVSIAAEKAGYFIGYLSGVPLLKHLGTADTKKYRQMKDMELRKNKSPLDV